MSLLPLIESIVKNLLDRLEKHFSIVILALVTLTFCAVFIGRIDKVYQQKMDMGGIEYAIIYGLQLVMDEGIIYEHPESSPYSVIQYSPLYYYFLAVPGKLWGVDTNDVDAVFRLSRSVSLFFNLGFILFGFLIARRHFQINWVPAAILAGLNFILLDTQSFSRPDSLYSIFFMVSIFYLLRMPEAQSQGKSIRLAILLGLWVSITIFAKQSGIILPVLILFLLIFLSQDFKSCLFFLLSLSISGVIGWGILLATGNEGIYENAVMGIQNGINLGWFWRVMVLQYFFTIKGAILTSIMLFSGISLIIKEREKEKILGYSILALWAFALVTSLKNGATPSYFTECLMLAFIGLFHSASFKIPKLFLLLAFTIYCAGVISFTGAHNFLLSREKPNPEASLFQNAQLVQDYFAEKRKAEGSKPILNLAPNYIIDLSIYDQSLFPIKSVVDHCVIPLQTFTYENYHEQMTACEQFYLVVEKGKTPPYNYIGVSYQPSSPADTVGDLLIYSLSGKMITLTQ
ncbi:MAG: hypothetical protein AAF927_01990 [Bacteroidota bacterium]